jgi:hypothetical protein
VDPAGSRESGSFGEQYQSADGQALRQLNVAAEARLIAVNGPELHTIIAGPLYGRL